MLLQFAKKYLGLKGAASKLPFADKLLYVRSWLRSPLGRSQLRLQRAELTRLIKQHRGQRILQISPATLMVPLNFAPFKNIFRLQASCDHIEQASVGNLVSEYANLPFEDDSMDIVIVHHVLEFSSDSQAILKEAGRITSPAGHIIVMGFNPLSLSGIWSLCYGLFCSEKRVSSRKQLFVFRVKDWLRFLDFGELQTSYIGYGLPINNKRYIRFMMPLRRLCARLHLPFANTYCLLARKERAGMHILKDDWRTQVLGRALTPVSHVQPASVVVKLRPNEYKK